MLNLVYILTEIKQLKTSAWKLGYIGTQFSLVAVCCTTCYQYVPAPVQTIYISLINSHAGPYGYTCRHEM